MALLDFYNRASLAVDNEDYVIGIFIDLQKAFDTTDHKILLEKLSFYGIRGEALGFVVILKIVCSVCMSITVVLLMTLLYVVCLKVQS